MQSAGAILSSVAYPALQYFTTLSHKRHDLKKKKLLNIKCTLTNERPTRRHLLFYFTYYVPNMFRTLIYPSSGACDCVDELPHRSSCSQFVVCCSFCCGWYLLVFVLQAEAHNK